MRFKTSSDWQHEKTPKGLPSKFWTFFSLEFDVSGRREFAVSDTSPGCLLHEASPHTLIDTACQPTVTTAFTPESLHFPGRKTHQQRRNHVHTAACDRPTAGALFAKPAEITSENYSQITAVKCSLAVTRIAQS